MAALLLATSCSSGHPPGRYEVTSTVLSSSTPRELRVFAPVGEGAWPVVFAFHGINGKAGDMAELGRHLARRGVLVFAPTFRTDLSRDAGKVELARDAECGYRLARNVAHRYGGDLHQPMTFVGWSLGATLAIQGGLDEQIDPAGIYLDCKPEVPRADVIVALSGCHYEFQGQPSTLLDPSEWANRGASITLVAGERDTVCMPWQSERAERQLRAAGYDVRLFTLDGADHPAPVFHGIVNDTMVPASDTTAGERTVEIILDAIASARHRT